MADRLGPGRELGIFYKKLILIEILKLN